MTKGKRAGVGPVTGSNRVTLRSSVPMVPVWRKWGAGLLGLALAVQPGWAAPDPAMLQLFKILRDRGSISPEEYQLLVSMAGVPETSGKPAVETPGVATSAPTPTPAPGKAGEGVVPVPQGVANTASSTNAVTKAAAAAVPKEKEKWYQKFNVGGYTQFRVTALLNEEADGLNVPNDPSVSPTALFTIRRARFRMAGDVSPHLSLYAQVDAFANIASGGGSSSGVQLRDLYADVYPTDSREVWFRLGQSKVPYGWVNMQSSQNRSPMERPDSINSAVEGERDIGAFAMYAPEEARKRFKELVQSGLKGSGDYGVLSFGAYNGQGPNKPDLNGFPYWLARADYPFKLDSGQFVEVGLQGYLGRYVPSVQTVSYNGRPVTPRFDPDGVMDRRVAATAVWYPQPFGFEAEWNIGTGPRLNYDFSQINSGWLNGGYLQANYQIGVGSGKLFPYTRWHYYQGGRKFGSNAPFEYVNELDFGFEYSPWTDLELSVQYTWTFDRTNTSQAPYADVQGASRIEFQAQWNY
ncbi:MAG: porin [Verrucomicrobiota bacterium]